MTDSTIPPARAGWFIPLYNPNQNAMGWYDQKGNFHKIGAAPPTPGTDPNAYPLKMPAVAPGAPVTIGVGPDQIQIQISGNPTSIADGPPMFDVILDGKLIADELVCTDFQGMDHGQVFTINVTAGTGPHDITLSPSLTKPGLVAAWQTAVRYKSMPCYYNGPKPDARDNSWMVNATNIWNNLGWALTYTTTKAAEQPPLPVPDLSIISGATINGTPATSGTLANLADRTLAAGAGSTLKLPAGTFFGTTPVGPIIIEGADAKDPSKTIIDATGLTLAGNGKAILMPISTTGTFIARGLTLRGAACPDKNGAAVRQNGNGMNFRVEFCEITGCQNGLLTFAGIIGVFDSYLHGNGSGNGETHEIYAGGAGSSATSTLTVARTKIECGPLATHAIKSRMPVTIEDCDLTQSPAMDSGAVSGRIVDIPNGGAALIARTTLRMTPGAPVHEAVTYGVNDLSNGAQGVIFQDAKLLTAGHEQVYINAKLPAPLTIAASTYAGGPAPTLLGWQEPVNGAFTEAA